MQITNRGILILLIAAPIIALGTWAPVLQWVAVVYVVAVLTIFAIDWRLAEGPDRLEATRQHDVKLSLGARNPIRLSVRNRSRRPAIFWLRDEAPDAFDIEQRVFSGEIGPRRTWTETYYVRPLQRGDYHFADLHARWQGPLSLVIRQARLDAAAPVKVYPNLLEIRRYDLLLKQNRLHELGLRHARLFGEGTEFERMREYLPDDEFRRINWKATARRNRPITVEYQTERSQNIVAVLDTGRMMQSPVAQIAKLDYVVNAVLFLTYVATGKGDKVGLMTFADQVKTFIGPRQGRGQFYRMLELLYAVKADAVEPDYRQALSYLALKQRRRSLVVIFTDLSGGTSIQSLVSHVSVLAQRSLPLVVTISDPDIHAASQQQPKDSLSVYQRAAAEQLLDERQVTLDQLRRQGVLTLDVPANQLSLAVINRYLELKGRTLL